MCWGERAASGSRDDSGTSSCCTWRQAREDMEGRDMEGMDREGRDMEGREDMEGRDREGSGMEGRDRESKDRESREEKREDRKHILTTGGLRLPSRPSLGLVTLQCWPQGTVLAPW